MFLNFRQEWIDKLLFDLSVLTKTVDSCFRYYHSLQGFWTRFEPIWYRYQILCWICNSWNKKLQEFTCWTQIDFLASINQLILSEISEKSLWLKRQVPDFERQVRWFLKTIVIIKIWHFYTDFYTDFTITIISKYVQIWNKKSKQHRFFE